MCFVLYWTLYAYLYRDVGANSHAKCQYSVKWYSGRSNDSSCSVNVPEWQSAIRKHSWYWLIFSVSRIPFDIVMLVCFVVQLNVSTAIIPTWERCGPEPDSPLILMAINRFGQLWNASILRDHLLGRVIFMVWVCQWRLTSHWYPLKPIHGHW